MSKLLSVLTPSTTNYDAGTTGHGAMPVITRTEMAGLLSGISVSAFNFAMAKYCNDAAALAMLQFHCMQKAAEFAAKYGWKAQRGRPLIISLGALAAIESTGVSTCLSCQSPSMLEKNRCTCNRHRHSLRHVERAEYVGVCERSWRNTWRQRYEYLFDYCLILDSQVGRAVSSHWR